MNQKDPRLVDFITPHELCDKHFSSGNGCCCHINNRMDCRWVYCKNCKESTINCECGKFEMEFYDSDGNLIEESV